MLINAHGLVNLCIEAERDMSQQKAMPSAQLSLGT